jgi:hypothetical protein
MSICKTEKRSGDLLPKELKESGVNSKQFDYLLKNNTPQNEGNIQKMFIHENNCSRSKRILESFRSYGWYIFIPIIAMVITFVVIVYMIEAWT